MILDVGKGNDPNQACGAAPMQVEEMQNAEILTPEQIDLKWGELSRELSRAKSRLERLQSGTSGAGVNEAQRAVGQLMAKDLLYRREYQRRGGWSRAYAVPGGHVHSGRHCQTVGPRTRMSLMPELSGITEEQVVARVGHLACTVCYPSAPTHPAYQQGQSEAAAQAERRKADRCPGSGQPGQDLDFRKAMPQGRCPECGFIFGVSKSGLLRPHKPE